MSLIEKAVDQLSRDVANTLPQSEAAAASGTMPPEHGEPLIARAMDLMPPSPAASATPSTPSGAPSKSSPVSPHDSPTAATQPRPVASPRRPDPALISIDTLRTRGFVTPDAAPTALSQEFRVIKRPLLDNAFGRGVAPVANGRRVMVTSAYSGEGKSFCAINLAMSIAAERDT
jgi:protein-tyrosine kinase